MKENTAQFNMQPTQSGKRMSQGLDGVRKAAKERKQERFTSLLHHLNVDLLRESFYALQRKASPGVDGVTWQEYGTGLEDRLIDLHSRVHRGAYRAQPSRRVYIPKADGRQRPLGIAAVEDKIVQQAVVTILNQIYEVDFKGFSYGFRPSRSPHQALDALAVGIQRKKVNWILDADVMGFFDNLSHEWAIKFIEHRVADRRILRLIRKWLKAGVSEDGQWSKTDKGTPQGSVATPLTQKVISTFSPAWR
jgi:group II intron reverse transcriptase/maturase